MNDEIENLILELKLDAPRVTKELIESKIKSVEYVTHMANTGRVLSTTIPKRNCS